MELLLQDLRFALRMLSRAPGFTAAVVLVLALGIGSNSAIFTALDKTVIRPLPYAQPDRLAVLWEDFSAFGAPKERVSPGTFFDWKRRTQVFTDLAAYAGAANFNLVASGPPEEIFGQHVTANLLPLLGVRPLLGRTFASDEEGPGARVVVLSYRLWQRRYGGDVGLVGHPIQLNGEKYSVIGVMPKGFSFPNRQTELWVPLDLPPEILARRDSHFFHVVGRLKPDRDLQQAQSDMTAVARALAAEFPRNYARVGITLVPLKDEMLGQSRLTFVILLSAAACVLLIACANVANLLLARASNRQQEIGVRLALGAKRFRIVRQILTENLLLGGAGGALGLVVAHWSMAGLEKMIPDTLASMVELRLDWRALGFTAAVSILTAVLCGLAPALQLSHVNLAARDTIGHGNRRLRDALVGAEIAIALVLVTGAALLIQTLLRMRAVDPGFRASGILTANIDVPFPKYDDVGKRQRFFSGVLAEVGRIPGVKSAGLTSDLPYTSRGNTMGLSIEGQPDERGRDALFRLVSAGYLETIGARLKAGRFLLASDNSGSTRVVVINQAMARQYWPNQNPLGHRIDAGTGGGKPLWMMIVGVVEDIRERGLDLGNKPAVYVPFTQTEISFFLPSEIAMLTSREPLSISKELQQAVWNVDAEQPVSGIRTMSAIVDDELASRSDVLRLLGAFAALALVLAALGIYGLLAYVVAQRTREIGLRMAIGARQWDIMRTILRYSARLALVGLVAGLAAATAAMRLLSALLYGISPLDWKTLLGVSALLSLMALLASFLPARRAASVDPVIALRAE